MMHKPNILIADDEIKMLDILQLNLSERYNIFVAQNGLEAQTILHNQPVDLIISDLKMPKMDGKELLEYVRREFKMIPFIVITAFGTIEDAVDAVKQGAFDYVVKPVKIDALKQSIEKALNFHKILSENKTLKAQLQKYEEYRKIITVDLQMKKMLEQAEQAAKTNANILILGESGTGKQLLAEFIHQMSNVAKGPFVEINAGAIPRELLESELFGYEKGAFTGAGQTKKGKFELADKGTFFLDEIGEMPIDMQVKLLHVLERNKLTRVGGTKEIEINVRLIAATNKNLLEEIENKHFRSDLYYRLRVVQLNIPPLRQRISDIPVLVNFFLKKHAQNNTEYKISPEALTVLTNYSWPGNIRELENIVQQSIIFCSDGNIESKHLPPEILENASDIPTDKEAFQKLKIEKTEKIISHLEFQFLDALLKKSGGNITRAAEICGYNRRQLQNLIAKYNINTQNYKS